VRIETGRLTRVLAAIAFALAGCGVGWVLSFALLCHVPVGDCMDGQFRMLAIIIFVGGPAGAIAGIALALRLTRSR
jgi:hypothetical protein